MENIWPLTAVVVQCVLIVGNAIIHLSARKGLDY